MFPQMAELLDYCLLICAAAAGVSGGYLDPQSRAATAAGWHCPPQQALSAAARPRGASVCQGWGGVFWRLRPKGLEGPLCQGHCGETGWPKSGCESLLGKEKKIPGARSESHTAQENNSFPSTLP